MDFSEEGIESAGRKRNRKREQLQLHAQDIMSRTMMTRMPFAKAMALVASLLVGCGLNRETSRVTITQTEALEAFESLLPVGADSVVRLYQQNNPAAFHAKYQRQLEDTGRLIDSLNTLLEIHSRIETLAIDHSFENLGNAACSGRTISLSSSYFLLYNDPLVIRSVITHEFGHKVYLGLTEVGRLGFEELWGQLGSAALLYLFRDGEYSGNAKFGGHPYESPSELFASAFNLFLNREGELASRLKYVNQDLLPLIERLRKGVLAAAKKQ